MSQINLLDQFAMKICEINQENAASHSRRETSSATKFLIDRGVNIIVDFTSTNNKR